LGQPLHPDCAFSDHLAVLREGDISGRVLDRDLRQVTLMGLRPRRLASKAPAITQQQGFELPAGFEAGLESLGTCARLKSRIALSRSSEIVSVTNSLARARLESLSASHPSVLTGARLRNR
jgi:hypothetical protein